MNQPTAPESAPLPVISPDPLLSPTSILDCDHPQISQLVRARSWTDLPEFERIGAIYTFVRDEIDFGYNADDDIAASRVLADGFGQCNTKASLLMALLRGSGIRCRFHGAAIHKLLQQGIVNGLFYRLAPDEILHSWVEVEYNGRWVGLEGVIVDRVYLDGLRETFPDRREDFLGYGVGTTTLGDPPIEWDGSDTEIQMTALSSDHGVFDDPDSFYASIGTNLSGARRTLYRLVVRRWMNRNARSIRRRSPNNS
jgi:transglutaminase-like putative cysteine protease